MLDIIPPFNEYDEAIKAMAIMPYIIATLRYVTATKKMELAFCYMTKICQVFSFSFCYFTEPRIQFHGNDANFLFNLSQGGFDGVGNCKSSSILALLL